MYKFLLLILFTILLSSKAFAISEYGLRCEDNKACLKCIDNHDCIKCMHICWNGYGYADSDITNTANRTDQELCQLKRAKWCNAQCWDPDDTKKPDYVTTKPKCDEDEFYYPDGGIVFPEKRPDF